MKTKRNWTVQKIGIKSCTIYFSWASSTTSHCKTCIHVFQMKKSKQKTGTNAAHHIWEGEQFTHIIARARITFLTSNVEERWRRRRFPSMSSSASSVSRPSFQVGAVTGRPGSAGVQNGSRYLKICLYAGPALAYKVHIKERECQTCCMKSNILM